MGTGTRLKIAIFHMGFFYSGGGERTVLSEAVELSRRGHDVRVYGAVLDRKACFPELINDVYVRAYLWDVRWPFLRKAANMAYQSLLARLLSKRLGNFDGVIAHAQPAPWIAYATDQNYVCYLQQPTRFLYPREVDRGSWAYDFDMKFLSTFLPKTRYVHALDRLSISAAKTVLVNSHWIAEWANRVYRVRTEACPLGVDTKVFRRKLEVPKEEDLVLLVCRHVPQKKPEWLIEMMPEILSKRRRLKVIIAGTFSRHTTELRNRAAQVGLEDRLELTELHGERLVDVYNRASVLAFTPPQEDFGLAVIEAMACETPVVCWDIAGPGELVVQGQTGYKAKPYDKDEFCEKIITILSDTKLRDELGARAREHVRKWYTWVRHVDGLEKCLLS